MAMLNFKVFVNKKESIGFTKLGVISKKDNTFFVFFEYICR